MFIPQLQKKKREVEKLDISLEDDAKKGALGVMHVSAHNVCSLSSANNIALVHHRSLLCIVASLVYARDVPCAK